MNCPNCNSQEIVKNGIYKGDQQYRCKDCDKRFYDRALQKTGRKPEGDRPLTSAERFRRWSEKRKAVEMIKLSDVKVGDRFDLWEVTESPSLSTKGKVTARSQVVCLCHGCNNTASVTIRYLREGLSGGCRKCRFVGSSKPTIPDSNAKCPDCDRPARKGSTTQSKTMGLRRAMFCNFCEKNFTVSATTVNI